MKKFLIVLLFFIPLTFLFTTYVYADDNLEENKKNLEQDNRVENFYNYINNNKTDEEFLNGLNAKEFVTEYMKKGQSSLSVDMVIKSCKVYLLKEVKLTLKLMIGVLVIGVISALLKNLQTAFSNEAISSIAYYACFAVLILLLSKSFMISITLARDTITKLTDFMAVLLPVLVLLLTTAGGVTSAVTLDPVVVAAVGLTPRIYIDFLIPLISLTFVLQFVSNLTGENKITNLCKLLKQIALWSQGIVITIFIGILTVRSITTNTIDAVTLKTTKFAVDNFIPLVGKAFSDAITTVASYSLLMKNAISSVGLIFVCIIVLYPIIKIIIIIFTYKLTAALIEPISEKGIVSSIVGAADSLVILLSCVFSISIMFFVMVAMLASSGKFIVGG
ncbi:stage III sporulation protein AE [Clostridium cavendishii DSM 21758]|uniref:Stage III sporulation protein AE n=1 Tax=Clostridium cavendishii DSM 21758 TaxID=1121302 RepID=A0A1M6KKV5_9CLOT|nr:stage III sporulation protein AE [Clostridium cavendishii]SHJ59583.1 stage III sporulation protein AE [Clostridium cavendishii DSM 21758]